MTGGLDQAEPATRPLSARLLKFSLFFLVLPPVFFTQLAAASQQSGPPPVLRGQVVVGDVPIDSGTVSLHRVVVSGEGSGSVDSVSVGADGRFDFRLPSTPDSAGASDVYLTSVRYEGILYFSSPVVDASQLDSLLMIEVYETEEVSEASTPLVLESRTVLLESNDGGVRVTEELHLVNRGEKTLVPGSGSPWTWSHPLPDGASESSVQEVDLPIGSVSVEDGVVRVSAPLPPFNARRLMVRYTLPNFETAFPVVGLVETLNFAVVEPAPPIELFPLTVQGRLNLDLERTARFFSGASVSDTAIQLVVVEPPFRVPPEALFTILAIVLCVAGIALVRRRRPTQNLAPVGVPRRRWLLLQIAQLDEDFERDPGAGNGEAEHYRARRAELLGELVKLEH